MMDSAAAPLVSARSNALSSVHDPAAAAGVALNASPGSEFESTRAAGFPWLRFPPALEAHFLADTANERLTTLRKGGAVIGALSITAMISDWLMVPDQFDLAMVLRLLIMLPLTFLWLSRLEHMSVRAREWGPFGLSLAGSIVMVILSLRSHEPLAPIYLIGLTLIILVNGGLLRVRFWIATAVNLIILAMYGAAATALLANPPIPNLLSLSLALSLALGATAVFTLWGSYRLEYADRTHWLMSQHERLLQQSLEAGIDRLEALSRFDPLTGLANRRLLQSHLAQVWARARLDHAPVAALLIDIDHFKLYNDHLGHVAGDQCIQAVTQALSTALRRPGDLLARWGGEEFVAVLHDSEAAQGQAAAQRVLAAVSQLQLLHEASLTKPWVTVSIGVAAARASAAGLSPESLIAAADTALYRAKSQGRDQVAVHEAARQGWPVVHAATGSLSEPPTAAPARTSQVHAEVMEDLERPWSTLRFPGELERQYQQAGAAYRLKDFLLTGLLALLVFNIFLPVDYLLAHDVWEMALWLRLGLFTPVYGAVIILCWFLQPWILQAIPPWVHEAVVVVSGVSAGACLSYILASSHSPLIQYYHIGLMVVVTYGTMVQRLRFWPALIFSLMIYALHIHGVALVPAFNPRLLPPMVALVGATVLFTMMTNYATDREERRNYLLALRRKSLLEELGTVHRQTTRLSRVDPLTDLYNRRHVNEILAQSWQRATQSGESLAVIMVDVDHFKGYNDR
jgi:diguanylate cyclase (GGDEF)-like protein